MILNKKVQDDILSFKNNVLYDLKNDISNYNYEEKIINETDYYNLRQIKRDTTTINSFKKSYFDPDLFKYEEIHINGILGGYKISFKIKNDIYTLEYNLYDQDACYKTRVDRYNKVVSRRDIKPRTLFNNLNKFVMGLF